MDVKNTCEPVFFKTIMNALNKYDFFLSARDFAGTCELLNEINIEYKKIGAHYGKNILLKLSGTLQRINQLVKQIPKFDLSISSENLFCTTASKIRGKPSISFIQSSEIDNLMHKIWDNFLDYVLKPKSVNEHILIKNGVLKEKIFSFNGYKELLPISDFIPDKNFKTKIPFEDFIAIRPPPLDAMEMRGDKDKLKFLIIPQLVKKLSDENFNILYLPRYLYDRNFVKGFKNVHILEHPLNGLDIIWNSRGIITGSGTFAREAAGMGIPSVTTYNYEHHKNFLPVDKKLIEDGKILNSRHINEIIDYLLKSKKKEPNLNQAKKTKKEIINIINYIIDNRIMN